MPEAKPPAEPVDQLPEEVVEEMPLPSDPKTIFLGGLFLIALLAGFYVAGDIVLPFVLAFILNLLLQPAMRRLQRWGVPRILAGVLLILALFGTIVGIGAGISGPAADWAAKLPEGIPKLQDKLSFLRAPIDAVQRFLQRVENVAPAAADTPGVVKVVTTSRPGETLLQDFFGGASRFASGFLTTILFLFFLLGSADIFLRRIVELVPRFQDKRITVDIANQIEHDISGYLTTITMMNALVGVLTGIVMAVTGLGDPFLWGAVAFILNYVPIIGWLTAVCVFILAGLLTFDTVGQAFLPAGLYLLIHILEGETITPMLLARRFTLNPVIVVMSLVFWFWMWGVPGAVIAVPMLAVTKIVCDRVRPLAAFGHFLSG